jgi:hypothetical protein
MRWLAALLLLPGFACAQNRSYVLDRGDETLITTPYAPNIVRVTLSDSTAPPQNLKSIKVYPGTNADFTRYDDHGLTYAYESGTAKVTSLHWDDAAGKCSQPGGTPVEIIGR